MLLPLLSALSFLLGVALETLCDLNVNHLSLTLVLTLFLLKLLQSSLEAGSEKPLMRDSGLFFRLFAPLLNFPKVYKKLITPCLGLLIGVLRMQGFESQEPQDLPFEKWVEFEGVVVEEPDRREDHQKLTLNSEFGRVLVKASLYEDFEFGEILQVKGNLEEPSADLDGFSYKDYLRRYRVWSTMPEAYLQSLEAPPPSLRAQIYEFKHRLEFKISQRFMEPEASFAAGLLLGSRKGMDESLVEAFKVTGLSHIVAISGYNITLIIAGLFWIFSFVALKPRIWISSIAIVLFVILVGMSAAVLRAGVMGILTLCGIFLGMKSQVFFALLWSAVLMVLANPMILIHDVGFQLSFSATLGLLVWMPVLESLIPAPKKTFWEGIHEALLLTLCAQMITAPLIAFHFGRLSLISPMANVLVAPFIPLGMGFSALALFFGAPFSALAWFYLRVVERIALFLAQLPFADFSLKMGTWEFSFLMALQFCFLLRFYKPILIRAFLRGGEEVFPLAAKSEN